MFHRRVHLFAIAWFLLACLSLHAEAPDIFDEHAAFPPPLPAIQQFAAEHEIPLQGFSAIRIGPALPGDHATILVSLQDEKKIEQWLVELKVDELTATEKSANYPDSKLYISTGNVIVLHTLPVALKIQTYGPFSSAYPFPAPAIREARVLANGDNLALGLDRACAACLRIVTLKKELGEKGLIGFAFRPTPFLPDEIGKGRAIAEHVKMTATEERVMAGSGPALGGFFQIAQNTPGLREIVYEVTDLPSAWSIIKRGGRVDSSIKMDSPHIVRLSENHDPVPRYLLPIYLELNEHPALVCGIVVRSPEPPYLTTAGILGITAHKPHSTEHVATVQLLSATTAE